MQASLLDKRDHQIDAPFYAVMQGLDLGLWTLTALRILQTWSDWRTRCGLNETLHVVIQLFGVSLCTCDPDVFCMLVLLNTVRL